MNRATRFFSLLVAVSTLNTAAIAQEASSSISKDEINVLIEQYIKDNPDVIINSVQEYDRQQKEMEEAAQAAKLGDHQEYLETGDLPRVGNPDGDIKIVEFYDYNCGYCKRAFDDLRILLEADPNVEVTLVDMPILGENSLESSKWSMAAATDEKFFEFHAGIMSFPGQKSEANLRTIATAAGIDPVALKQSLENPAIIDSLEKNIQVARDIGIRGTPGFVINGQIYRGYLGYDGLKAVIDEIRLSNKPAPASSEDEPSLEIPEEAAPAGNVNG